MEWIRPYLQKYEEIGLLYDHDILNRQRLIRIRLTNDPLPQTPVTASYQARFVIENVRAIVKRPKQLNPRRYLLCYENIDFLKTERTVYNPYAPTNFSHNNIYFELINGNFGFKTIEYKGEQYISSFEDLLND